MAVEKQEKGHEMTVRYHTSAGRRRVCRKVLSIIYTPSAVRGVEVEIVSGFLERWHQVGGVIHQGVNDNDNEFTSVDRAASSNQLDL